MAKGAEGGLDELKRKHAQETSELVQTTNKKCAVGVAAHTVARRDNRRASRGRRGKWQGAHTASLDGRTGRRAGAAAGVVAWPAPEGYGRHSRDSRERMGSPWKATSLAATAAVWPQVQPDADGAHDGGGAAAHRDGPRDRRRAVRGQAPNRRGRRARARGGGGARKAAGGGGAGGGQSADGAAGRAACAGRHR
jgi:hypothetical protein